MSQPDHLSGGDLHSALLASLGSDLQCAVAPFKAEILAIAHHLRGDVHRAAMRLLVERDGRRPSAMEQQLIITALADLQGTEPPAATLDRAAARFAPASSHRRQVTAQQVH